ncbi:Transposase IS116/IS110/IS902 family protein [compost metagenome]
MQTSPVTPSLVHCVDLAKDKFQVHSFSHSGECLKQRTLTRTQFVHLFADPQQPRGLIVMEACASASHWCRRFEALGHRTRQLPAQFVAKHRLGSKNDGNDADAIHVTHRDSRVRSVPTKTLAQQDLAALHSARQLLLKQRVQLSNQIRGLLAERGCVAGKGERGFQELLSRAAGGDALEVTAPLLTLIGIQLQVLRQLEEQLAVLDRQVEQLARQLPQARLLTSIFGVGPLIATAFVAEHGAGVARYADARQFAASLGLTPREHSSGNSRRLGGITKWGDAYRRRLLIQGASSVVQHCQQHQDPLCELARRLLEGHKCRNVVTTAVANRMARIIYAVLKHGEAYRMSGSPQR